MRVLALSSLLLLGATAAQAAVFDYFVGDIDNFGGSIGTDNRSAAEAAATNGAQYTDLSDDTVGYRPFTDDNFPLTFSFDIDDLSSITSMTLSIYSLGIQTNVPLATDSQLGDAFSFEGDILTGFFDGVDQGSSGQGLLSGAISSTLFDKALDGVAEFTLLLNSQGGLTGPLGEPAAFDYVQLTIEGEPAVPPIPLPAGVILLMTGLGALGVARRRRA